MSGISFLLLFPLAVAVLLLFLKADFGRGIVVKVAAAVLCVASVYFMVRHIGGESPQYPLEAENINRIMLAIEILLGGFIFYLGVKHKKYLVSVLITLQVAISVWFEMTLGEHMEVDNYFITDKFSLIMVLIIGIIGSLICVYAVGYMRDFQHHHKELGDRRPFFFFILFVFLSAMFGIVLSNHLMWVYFFWEITTLCSFLLIGYTRTVEATNNAFRALLLNLLGGLAFAIAIPCLFILTKYKVITLEGMLQSGSAIVLLPAVLISFAGITKSAQFPFSSWLLGAMVAPTPTSALLHSSTMVKAGVYIIIRLAPILAGTMAGYSIALIGVITFLSASLIAISQRNAKKLLAYSTIANLGLIVACGGIGTFEAVWAAILLIIFHAVAKSLLFLCVGTVEHNIDSRDIEDMHGLIVKMPRITVMLVIGIAGMFLAPFGMLISKWAALKAFVDASPLIACFIAFGSAATLVFWTKWLGKLLAIRGRPKGQEDKINNTEWFTLSSLSLLTVGVCMLFPLLSEILVDPYVKGVYGTTTSMGAGNIIIMLTMMGLIFLLPLRLLFYGKDLKKVDAYLAGANTNQADEFVGALGKVQTLYMKNYYFEKYFSEKKLLGVTAYICSFLLIAMLVFGYVHQ